MLFLQILGAVAALALGVWLGLPGRYDRRQDEIDRAMGAPGGRTKKVKRHFTPLAWVRRQIDVSSRGRSRSSGGGGGGFKLERPDRDRTSPSSGSGGGGAFKLRRPDADPGRGATKDERPSEISGDGRPPPPGETPTGRGDRLRGRFRLRHPEEGGG